MDPTDDRQPIAGQMELPLPPVTLEAVLVDRMMTVISENTSNVALCGETILMLQRKVDSLTETVFALLEAYRRQSGPSAERESTVQQDDLDGLVPPVDHAGYTVKEFAELTKRSKSYVYRLITTKQVTRNMAGLITHESLVQMRMIQGGHFRRPRRSKWA